MRRMRWLHSPVCQSAWTKLLVGTAPHIAGVHQVRYPGTLRGAGYSGTSTAHDIARNLRLRWLVSNSHPRNFVDDCHPCSPRHSTVSKPSTSIELLGPLRHREGPPGFAKEYEDLLLHLAGSASGGGGWCRWVADSADHGLFWIGITEAVATAGIKSLVFELADLFLGTFPRPHPEGEPQPSLTVLIKGGVSGGDAERFLQDCRLELLKRGTVVAFLHPASDIKTLNRLRRGFPYRTVSSFLTARYAVTADHLFCRPNQSLRLALADWLSLREFAFAPKRRRE